jgi:hypothetical protein
VGKCKAVWFALGRPYLNSEVRVLEYAACKSA